MSVLSSSATERDLPMESYDYFGKAAEIFALPIDQRSELQKKILRMAITKVKYFESALSNSGKYEDYLEKCCSVMNLEIYRNHEPVFHFNEIGRKFFVILQGKIDIYIPKSFEELREEYNKMDKELSLLKSMSMPNRSNSKPTIQAEPLEYEPKSIERRDSTHGNINDLNQDSIIEEEPQPIELRPRLKNKLTRAKLNMTLAISCQIKNESIKTIDHHVFEMFSSFPNHKQYIDRGIFKFKKIRQLGPGDSFGELALTTNKCRTATAIAIGDVKLISLTKKDYRYIFEAKIERTFGKYKYFQEVFPGCSTESISKFAYNFHEKKYRYGQKLYSKGEEPIEFFLIFEGEVQLIIQLGDDNKKKKAETDPISFLNTKLVNLGPGIFVGEEEVLKNQKERVATAISVSSEIIVYSVLVEEFKVLRNRHPDLVKIIIEKMESKNSFCQERIANLQQLQQSIKSNNANSNNKKYKLNYRDIQQHYENNNNHEIIIQYSNDNTNNPKSGKNTTLPIEDISFFKQQSQNIESCKINVNNKNQNTDKIRKNNRCMTNNINKHNQKQNDLRPLTKDITMAKLGFDERFSYKYMNPVVSPDRYITSRGCNEFEFLKSRDPTEIVESKIRLIKSQDKFYSPIHVGSPLFAKGWSKINSAQINFHTNQSSGVIENINNSNEGENNHSAFKTKQNKKNEILSRIMINTIPTLTDSKSLINPKHNVDTEIKSNDKTPHKTVSNSKDHGADVIDIQSSIGKESKLQGKYKLMSSSSNTNDQKMLDYDKKNAIESTLKTNLSHDSPSSPNSLRKFTFQHSTKSLAQAINDACQDIQNESKKNYTIYGRSLYVPKSPAMTTEKNFWNNNTFNKQSSMNPNECDSKLIGTNNTDINDNKLNRKLLQHNIYSSLNTAISTTSVDELCSPFSSKNPKINLTLNIMGEQDNFYLNNKIIKNPMNIERAISPINTNNNFNNNIPTLTAINNNTNMHMTIQRLGEKTVIASKHNMFRMNPTKTFLKKLFYRDNKNNKNISK